MTDLRKAAEMALKWMEATHHTAMTTYSDEAYEEHCNVEKELRQALAQPEQEPVKCTCGYAIGHPLVSKCICTPPKREWVGLTDEEMEYIWGITPEEYVDKFAFARAIEAKLKEKNGG